MRVLRFVLISLFVFSPTFSNGQVNQELWKVDIHCFLGLEKGVSFGLGSELSFLPINTGPVRWGTSIGVKRSLMPWAVLSENVKKSEHYWSVPVMVKSEYSFPSNKEMIICPFISLSAGYSFSSGFGIQKSLNWSSFSNNNMGVCFEPELGISIGKHLYVSLSIFGQFIRHLCFSQYGEETDPPLSGSISIIHNGLLYRFDNYSPYYLSTYAALKIGARF